MAGENHCSVGQIDQGIWQKDFESLTSPSNYLTLFLPLVSSLGPSYSALLFVVNFFFKTIFIHLAVLDLNCITRDLRCGLWDL